MGIELNRGGRKETFYDCFLWRKGGAECTFKQTIFFFCRTNFSLDLLCSFPTDIIVLAIWPDSLGKSVSQ